MAHRNLKLSDDLDAVIQLYAEDLNVNWSEAARRLLQLGLEGLDRWPPPEPGDLDDLTVATQQFLTAIGEFQERASLTASDLARNVLAAAAAMSEGVRRAAQEEE